MNLNIVVGYRYCYFDMLHKFFFKNLLLTVCIHFAEAGVPFCPYLDQTYFILFVKEVFLPLIASLILLLEDDADILLTPVGLLPICCTHFS